MQKKTLCAFRTADSRTEGAGGQAHSFLSYNAGVDEGVLTGWAM